MKKIKGVFGIAFLLLLLCACTPSDEKNKTESERKFLLGTTVQITIDQQGKRDVLEECFRLVQSLGERIDVNDASHESEIDKINENAGRKFVKVDSNIFRLIEISLRYAKESDGLFDPTIGPITSLWHIGFDDARKPSQAEIDQALKRINYKDVELDKKNERVFLRKRDMKLDLGAIAKGFIADEVAELLQKRKVKSSIIDLGGNIYVLGHSFRGDFPWTVGIQDPNKARNTVIGYLKGENESFVTSGIYERYLKVGGKTYHHLMNPKTGYPFENDLAGVTIQSKHSVDGDGLSTTLFALGVEKGKQFIEKMSGTEALFVTKDDKIEVTSGLVDSFELDSKSGYHLAAD
ncbi:MAG: FAD:protein FMN transferase [Streptococcaceae bacterium]|jgi:thiamine biosynthesis lipoprotein|nr:FAD:protein FMN transferase [Streptococcaceae bacterium]